MPSFFEPPKTDRYALRNVSALLEDGNLAPRDIVVDPSLREYRPDWYQARNSFSSPSTFGSALASSLVSASASASTPPASSSSSSGGSSGGGSSGGGSGGGGGGGW